MKYWEVVLIVGLLVWLVEMTSDIRKKMERLQAQVEHLHNQLVK